MKKMIIGLAVLSSAAVFADCNKDTAECHLGTYAGVTMKGYYGNVTKDKCQIEITKSRTDKDDIQLNYTEGQLSINNKVSSNTQKFSYYAEISSDGSILPAQYISLIRLKKNLPEGSKKKAYKLDLQLDENLELVGVNVQEMKYSRLSLDVLLGIHSAWSTRSYSCTNLVKIK